MRIVLDTTEFFDDLRAERTNFTFLASFLVRHPAYLIVPRMVIEEVVNHFREKTSKTLQKAESALENLRHLAPDSVQMPTLALDLDNATDEFRSHLERRLIQWRADQPDYEGVSVSALVNRALQRRKPFDSEGKVGFRDALIWESIVAAAQAVDDAFIFVTRNKRDFGQHGGLADDLRNELADLGISSERITVCEGLGRFIEEYVKPSLDRLDSIHQQISDGSFLGFANEQFFADEHVEIRRAVDGKVRISDFDAIAEECLSRYDEPELGEFESVPDSVEVVDAWGLEGGEVAVGIDYTVEGTVRCLEQTENFWGEDDIEDFEGNAEFVVRMTVILNRDTGEVSSWEVNDLDISLTRGWPFPDYD